MILRLHCLLEISSHSPRYFLVCSNEFDYYSYVFPHDSFKKKEKAEIRI